MRSRPALVAVVVAVVVVAAVLYASASRRHAGPPLDPDSTEPDGTRAMVELLAGFGVTVDVVRGVTSPPDPDEVPLVLVLEPRLGEEGYRTLRTYARRGGTVVVAAADSALAPEQAGELEPGAAIPAGTCTVAALAGVEQLHGLDTTFVRPADAAGCFGRDAEAAVIEQPLGQGRLLHVGGAEAFTNRYLDEGDNAVLVTDLLAGAGRGPMLLRPALPGATDGDKTLLELLPGGFWRMLLQLTLALLLLVWASAVRLGRPVREPALLRLAGTALTESVSQLYQRTGRSTLAAGWLRRRARRQLERLYRLPPDASPGELVAAVTGAAGDGAHTDRYWAALRDRPVSDGAGLVELAGTLDGLREEVSHGARQHPTA